eukprot:Skav234379  [mRNA]  locus=scaffold2071:225188:236822:- [translate_table: standard]
MMNRSIHPMPYVLRYDASTGAPNMRVSRASNDARVVQYGDAETNGADKVRYYFSPFVSEFGLSAVESASQEGQIIVKENGEPNYETLEFRLYAVDASGNFADESFDFHPDGTMTKAFEGWIRLAEVQAPEDREILDFHAQAVLVDWQLELEDDGVIKSIGNGHIGMPGYFVVSAAVLVKLKPEFAQNQQLVSFIDTLIRDTTNPSIQDLGYGIHLWGAVTQREPLRELGTTMLTLCAMTIREFFLMTEDNLHHPADFVTNHATGRFGESRQMSDGTLACNNLEIASCLIGTAHKLVWKSDQETNRLHYWRQDNHPCELRGKITCGNIGRLQLNFIGGIFFQNKVDYATWFGWRYDFIHGIQMLPVTPALLMIRTPKFCRQEPGCPEWDNILSHLPLSPTDPWTSLLVTGTLSIIEPQEAYNRPGGHWALVGMNVLNAMLPEHMDDGLTWAWALYWSASLEAGASGAPPSSSTASTSTQAPEESTASFHRPWENLALYRLAVASSELSPADGAQRAVDGLFVTRWSPTVADPTPWITVDLGSSHALSHVVLLWGEFHPSGYLLQGANVNDQWTTLAVVLGSSDLLRSDLPRPTFARWLRVVCQSSGDLRLWEFQVFEDTETPTTETSSTTVATTTTTTVATTTATASQGTTSETVVVTTPETTVATSTVPGPSTTTPFYGRNLAFQKPVLSSSFRSPLEHAYRAVDGDLDSQWASVALNDQWLWVDLLGLYAVNRVVLLFDDVPQQFVVCLTACSVRELTIHGVNLALQQPVLASTQQLPDQYAARATDGSLQTQWTSAGDVEPWIWVDLFGVYQVVEVAVHWSSDAEYEVQSSRNAVDWTPLATASGLSGQTVRTALAPTPAQWIRIVCRSFVSTCSIKELQVYDVAGSDSPVATVAPTAAPVVQNVALNKPVLASSFVSPGNFASRAVDGLTETPWQSAASGNQWIWVDLLGRHTLDHVKLLWGSQLPSSFVLEISPNAVDWSAASASQDASGGAQQLAMDGVVTQWLRVHCTGGCSLQELQVGKLRGARERTGG